MPTWGWYEDPTGDAMWRFWDGHGWSAAVSSEAEPPGRPPTYVTAPPPDRDGPEPAPRRWRRWTVAAAIAAALFGAGAVVGLMASSGEGRTGGDPAPVEASDSAPSRSPLQDVSVDTVSVDIDCWSPDGPSGIIANHNDFRIEAHLSVDLLNQAGAVVETVHALAYAQPGGQARLTFDTYSGRSYARCGDQAALRLYRAG